MPSDKPSGVSFEYSASEQAVVVYSKYADGSRKPKAYLYTMLDVDRLALGLEANGASEDMLMMLKLVASRLQS